MNLNRIAAVVFALGVSVVLVRQQLSIQELKESLARRAEVPSAETPALAVDEIQPVASADIPTPPAPENRSASSNQPDTIPSEAVRKLQTLTELMRKSPGYRLQELAKQVQADPEAGVESVRQYVAERDKPDTRASLEASVGLLGTVPREVAMRELRRYYEMGSPYLKAVAAGELARFGEDDLLRDYLPEMAATKLRSPDMMVRIEAIDEIARTRSALALPYLMPMLKDEEVRVRMRVANALGFIPDEASIAQLQRLQEQDQSPAIRDVASRSLERIGAVR